MLTPEQPMTKLNLASKQSKNALNQIANILFTISVILAIFLVVFISVLAWIIF